MSRNRLACTAAALAVLGTASPAFATGWQISANPPAVPGCPALQWTIARHDNDLTGIVWFADGSGFASAVGKVDPATNAFMVTLTPVSGSNPPHGTVSGAQQGDVTHAVIDGGGRCANMKLKWKVGESQATPEQ